MAKKTDHKDYLSQFKTTETIDAEVVRLVKQMHEVKSQQKEYAAGAREVVKEIETKIDLLIGARK